MTDVTDLIESIRESFTGSVDVYTKGSCYRFYLILKSVFPESEPWYDIDHVWTKIGDNFYDINGIRPNGGNGIWKMNEHEKHDALTRWGKAKYIYRIENADFQPNG